MQRPIARLYRIRLQTYMLARREKDKTGERVREISRGRAKSPSTKRGKLRSAEGQKEIASFGLVLQIGFTRSLIMSP
mgnify:CR=1 FL=1|jgi:hypothetical protein